MPIVIFYFQMFLFFGHLKKKRLYDDEHNITFLFFFYLSDGFFVLLAQRHHRRCCATSVSSILFRYFFFSLPGSKKVKIKGHIVHRTDNLRVWSYITFFYSSFLKASSTAFFSKSITARATISLSQTSASSENVCLLFVVGSQ